MNDKSRNKKVITHFSAQQPKIAGSTLTQNEKRAIMKELRRKKKEVREINLIPSSIENQLIPYHTKENKDSSQS